MDAFFTSVHERGDARLKGMPVVVAGRSRRAVVAGASYAARAFGVHSAMPLAQARQLCPNLVVVSTDPARYREASRQVHQILRRFTSPDLIEPVALDEAYMDLTVRSRRGAQSAEELARRIKLAIHAEVHLTASVGVSTSKLVAKIAGASRKPDSLVVVAPGEEADFLAPLAVSQMPGLGPRTEERLRLLGITSLGALAAYDTQRLVQVLGTSGAVLQRLAQGRDRNPVMGRRPAKTMSAEMTFEYDVTDAQQLDQALRELVQRIAGRLTGDGLSARTVYLKLKFADFRQVSRQLSRTGATSDAETIYRAARNALERSLPGGHPVRLIGVGVSGLVHPHPDRQLTLFD